MAKRQWYMDIKSRSVFKATPKQHRRSEQYQRKRSNVHAVSVPVQVVKTGGRFNRTILPK